MEIQLVIFTAILPKYLCVSIWEGVTSLNNRVPSIFNSHGPDSWAEQMNIKLGCQNEDRSIEDYKMIFWCKRIFSQLSVQWDHNILLSTWLEQNACNSW
jgi:hypothetical protein